MSVINIVGPQSVGYSILSRQEGASRLLAKRIFRDSIIFPSKTLPLLLKYTRLDMPSLKKTASIMYRIGDVLQNKLPGLSETHTRTRKGSFKKTMSKIVRTVGSFRGNKKQSKSKENISDTITKEPNRTNEIAHDIQTVPEIPIIINQKLFLDTEFSFSNNVWFYGELDIVYGYRRSLYGDTLSPNDYTGSLIARIDFNGKLEYSITYRIGSNVYIGELPQKNGEYCMDFLDIDQPRFCSLELLMANLIEEGVLKQVTFDWLISNVTF